MNARTARRLLRRGRSRSFWGRRAYLTVRIPLRALPEQPPPDLCQQFGRCRGFTGHYEREEGDKIVVTRIEHVSGGDPRRHKPDDPYLYFVERESEDDESPWFQWWEASAAVYDARAWRAWVDGKHKGERPRPIEVRALDEELVAAYRARRDWEYRYIGYTDFPSGHPLERFQEPRMYARATYGRLLDDRYLYLTFSVKYVNRRTAESFCNAFARAFTYATRRGVALRAM